MLLSEKCAPVVSYQEAREVMFATNKSFLEVKKQGKFASFPDKFPQTQRWSPWYFGSQWWIL